MEWKIVEVSSTLEDGSLFDLRNTRATRLFNKTLDEIMDYIARELPSSDVYLLDRKWHSVGEAQRKYHDQKLVAAGKMTQEEYDLLNGNKVTWESIFPGVDTDELYLRRRATEFLWER